MKVKTIKVTAEDIRIGQKAIKKGDRPTSQCCAIARAVKRRFRTKQVSWYYEGGNAGEWKLLGIDPKTREMTDLFVLHHDANEPVEPFSFQVSVTPRRARRQPTSMKRGPLLTPKELENSDE